MSQRNKLILVKVGMILTFLFVTLCCWSFTVKADMISTLDGVTISMNNGTTSISTDCTNPDEYCIYQDGEKYYITAHYSTKQFIDPTIDWTGISITSIDPNISTAYLYNAGYNFFIKYDLSVSSVVISHDNVNNQFFIALDTDAYFVDSADWYLYLVNYDYVTTADEWYNFGYNSGYARGISTGYDSGFADAYADYYMPRYNEGLADGTDANLSILSFVPGILGVMVGFIFQVLSIEALGISGLEIVGAMVSIIVFLIFFKIFISRS